MKPLRAPHIRVIVLLLLLGAPSHSFAQSKLSCIYDKLTERFRKKPESAPSPPALDLPEIPEPSGDRRIPLLGKSGLQIGWYDNYPHPIQMPYPQTDSEHLSYLYHATIVGQEKEPLHKITVIIPQFLNPVSHEYDEAHTNQIRDQVFKLISQLPKRHIDSVKRVKVHVLPSKYDLHWRSTYKNFSVTAAMAGAGDINIFPIHFKELLRGENEGAILHEYGHLLAEKFWKTSDPPQSYINAANRDRYTVSEYGNNHSAEDFAEAVRVYILTDGGKSDPSARRKFSNRFAYIDQMFASDSKARNDAIYATAAAAVSAGMFSKDAKVQNENGVVSIDDGNNRVFLLEDSLIHSS